MKKPVLFLLISLISVCQLFAQSTEDRVSIIRMNFNIVNSMEVENQSTGCKSAERRTISNDGFGENISYPQSSTQCKYPGGYKIITSKFEGWEWGATVKFYFKNDILFFVFSNYTNVMGLYELRTYYNNGRVIRFLSKDVYNVEGYGTSNRDLTKNSEDYNWISEFNEEKLSQSYKILK
jgi:hypothetical protein